MKVSVSGLGRCEVDLQDLQHLYLGHVAVEATLLGLVLGATLSVSLGLFTVALCHYLGVARLMLALSSTEPSLGQLYVDESRVGLDATGVHITWIRDPATAMMIVLGAVAYGLAGF